MEAETRTQSFVALVEPGGARRLLWEESDVEPAEGGWFWVHLNRHEERARQWLVEEAGLDPVIREALLQEETRPRAVALESGLLVILRGANLNPGADPDDLVSIRIWVESDRVISLARWKLRSISETREELLDGRGPTSPGGLLAELTWRLVERIAPVVDNLGDQADALEEQTLESPVADLRQQLSGMRRQAIQLRRHLAPQREAVHALMREERAHLHKIDRARLREAADRLARYVEELDESRERIMVSQEELSSRLNEQMNRAMYTLSLVTAVFLPLGLLTGLLGINVGGIPGSDNGWAFLAVCLLLLVLALLEWTWIRRHFKA